jgi:hypothetical protein
LSAHFAAGTLDQLKSKPGFVSALLDRIQQNQGDEAWGVARSSSNSAFLFWRTWCVALLYVSAHVLGFTGTSLENAFYALEEACSGDGSAQGDHSSVDRFNARTSGGDNGCVGGCF